MQFPLGCCDLASCCRLLEGEANPRAGGGPGGWSMIGWWGFPMLETTACSCRIGSLRHSSRGRNRMRIGSQRPGLLRIAPDAGTWLTISATERQSASVTDRDPGCRQALGQRRPPPAQANQSPPESTTNGVSCDYSRPSRTHSKQGPPVSRSSCGIHRRGAVSGDPTRAGRTRERPHGCRIDDHGRGVDLGIHSWCFISAQNSRLRDDMARIDQMARRGNPALKARRRGARATPPSSRETPRPGRPAPSRAAMT